MYNIQHLLTGYAWTEIDKPGAVLVDMGGGHGACAQALTAVTRDLKFVVEDVEETVETGRAALPEALKDRVEFMAHDYLIEQPVKGAEVYLFHGIMHDYSDELTVKILQALVSALREGSRVLLYEWESRDCLETGLRTLFEKAHPSFRLANIIRPKGTPMCIVEAVWIPSCSRVSRTA